MGKLIPEVLDVWAPANPYLRGLREKVRDEGRKVFLSMLEVNPEASLLDLGCSIGDFTQEISNKIGTSKISGVDKMLYNPKEGKFYEVDLNRKLPFEDEKFDVITASQVIEHLQEPDGFLKEIYRVLKPGGYAIISTPNLASWHNILFLTFGYQPPVASLKRDHTRLLTTKGLVELLKLRNFKIEKMVGVGFYPLPNFLARIACFLDRRHSVDVIVKVKKE